MLSAMAVAVLAGCGDELPEACRDVSDYFQPSYEYVSGNCDDLTGYWFSISYNLAARSQQFPDDIVVSSTAESEGCGLRVTQSVHQRDRLLERLDGQLEIHEDGSATGTVVLERFDARGEVTCHGEYDAVLVDARSR